MILVTKYWLIAVLGSTINVTWWVVNIEKEVWELSAITSILQISKQIIHLVQVYWFMPESIVISEYWLTKLLICSINNILEYYISVQLDSWIMTKLLRQIIIKVLGVWLRWNNVYFYFYAKMVCTMGLCRFTVKFLILPISLMNTITSMLIKF